MIQIVAFNCHGVRNFIDTKSFFLQFDVIFLCETWITDNTAPAMEGFTVHCVPATRSATGRGRPAGGTAMYTRHSLEAELTHCDTHLSVVNLRTNPSLTIAGFYLNPSDPIAPQLGGLQDLIESRQGYIVAIGDFNCRIGGDANELDGLILTSEYLNKRRVSCDTQLSVRGSALLRLVNREGLVIINGRTATDPRGDFTFISSIGKSVVDLVICSPLLAGLVTDGGTVGLGSGSDHFPVFCKVSLSHSSAVANTAPAANTSTRFRWNPVMRVHFNHLVQDHITVNYQGTDSPSCLQAAVVSSAEQLALRSRTGPRQTISDNPWFNHTCRFFKKCRQNALCVMRTCRYLDEETRNYLFLRGMYNRVLSWAKAEYYHHISSELFRIKDSKDFWRLIKKLSVRAPPQTHSLAIEAVEAHFQRSPEIGSECADTPVRPSA